MPFYPTLAGMHACVSDRALQIDRHDNVGVALRDLRPGEEAGGVRLGQPVPAGHKFALRPIAAGEPVRKFGNVIGVASAAIAPGAHVHSHNLRGSLEARIEELSFSPAAPAAAIQSTDTFEGYRRPGGRVGIRNEIWIINTVGCINHAADRIARLAHAELSGGRSGIDGVYAFHHPFGCSQLGDDLRHTQAILSALVNHPNAAAVLVIGLGCENNQLADFLQSVGPQPAGRLRSFNAQEVPDEIAAGLAAVRQLADYAKIFRREAVPASELILGMKCGGSDGFSGITANPVVGEVADRAVAQGATVLLTEVPEMFGAERVLLERAGDQAAFEGLVTMVNGFRDYFRRYDEPIDENPSPGNKAGGITTLAEKSLGCVQKGGKAPVRQVLPYGGMAAPRLGGLSLINAPGNDGVSGTAMAAAGAHLVLFTTGRGNPMGFPCPTLKISSNNDLAQRKPQWIDFNAGTLADGVTTRAELSEQLWQQVLDIASGRASTHNEIRGFREIAIWKDGVTL